MQSGRRVVIAFLCFGAAAFAAQDVAGVVEGTVSKVDGATKTIVIKTADGSEQALRFVKRTSVHGAKETAAVSKDAFHGLVPGVRRDSLRRGGHARSIASRAHYSRLRRTASELLFVSVDLRRQERSRRTSA